MSTERTRKEMMRAAKEMRDFYQTLDVSERDDSTRSQGRAGRPTKGGDDSSF